MTEKPPYVVYLLYSEETRRTYVGSTNNPAKRLRQHNGELVGGAKYTRAGRPWRKICHVTGFPDRRTALQFEWRMHHPPKHLRGRGLQNRIRCLHGLLKMDRITKTCIPTAEMDLKVVFAE